MDALVSFLITVLILAAVFYLILWVLGVIGVPLPGKVVQIAWAIFWPAGKLLALYHMFIGGGGSLSLPKFR